MAGTVQYASHSNFFTGMVRDIPRHLIPDGAVYDALNIVITNSGSLAKRSGSTRVLTTATSMAPTQIAAQRSANIDGKKFLYPAAVNAGVVQTASLPYSSSVAAITPFTTSIVADAISTSTTYGDSVVYPVSSASGYSPFAWCGGVDFSAKTEATYSASSLSITSTSNSPEFTVGSTPAANMSIGGYVHLSNGGTNEYTGRIVGIGSTTITVDPAPIYGTATVPVTYTDLAYYPILPMVGGKSDGSYVASAGCVGTFVSGGDSRIVIGDVRLVDAKSGKSTQHPNRIMWSVREAADATTPAYYNATPGSAGSINTSGKVDGLVQATRMGFPQLNYIDIEDIERIVAVVPVGSGNMMVLGTKNCVMLSGYLLTQAGGVADVSLSRGGITANIRGFSQQVGCISAASVQRTTAGVMFAAQDGVYLTDGSTLVNTMTKKIANLWGDSTGGSSSFTFDRSTFNGTDGFSGGSAATGVLGSANINDSHYYISTGVGGFLCDLRNQFGWTRFPSGQLTISSSATDPDQTSNRVYATKYGATTSTSSLDRVVRLDRVVVPDNYPYDVDGTGINAQIVTRAYAEGDPAQKRRYRHGLFTYNMFGGSGIYPSATTYPSSEAYPSLGLGAFSVDATRGLAADGNVTPLGSKNADPRSSTSSVARFDNQVLSQAVTYTITTTGYPPAFSLFEITNGFNQLRPGRVV
jgi:hypothetical protein